jgi:hypothetical protein
MQAVQTPAEPPNHGRITLAIIGWHKNKSAELRKMAEAWSIKQV